MDKKVISRRVMIRQDGDRFRFQSQSDKMPGDIPLRLPYTEEQEAEIAMLLGVIYVRGDTNGYRRGVAEQKGAEKKSEPMANAPKECFMCHGVMDGYCYLETDGGKFPICNTCHQKLNVHPYRQSSFTEAMGQDKQVTLLSESEQPQQLPDHQPWDWQCPNCKKWGVMADRDIPELCVDCANAQREHLPHFAPGTLASLYGAAPDATDGDGDAWQEQQQLDEANVTGICPTCHAQMDKIIDEPDDPISGTPVYRCHNCPTTVYEMDDNEPEPHSLTPDLYARPADECTAENRALEPLDPLCRVCGEKLTIPDAYINGLHYYECPVCHYRESLTNVPMEDVARCRKCKSVLDYNGDFWTCPACGEQEMDHGDML